MTDPRPRPQYGEYATPEEQAKAMGVFTPNAGAEGDVATQGETSTGSTDSTNSSGSDSASSTAGVASPAAAPAKPAYGEAIPGYVIPVTPPASTGSTSTDTPATPYPAGSGADQKPGSKAARFAVGTGGRPRRTWDVVLTMVLLGFGVVFVTSSIPQYANFSATMDTVVAQMGYGDYSATALADNIGIAINVTQVILLAATVIVSIMLVRRNRLAFYVPLAGAAVAGIIVVVLLVIVLTGDPTLMQQVNPGSGS